MSSYQSYSIGFGPDPKDILQGNIQFSLPPNTERKQQIITKTTLPTLLIFLDFTQKEMDKLHEQQEQAIAFKEMVQKRLQEKRS